MSPSEPVVSVIIITHNSIEVLNDCLNHLVQAMRPIPSELIVVDNASSDGSASEVRRKIPSAYVMTNKANLGFAAACNQAAMSASGEYLLFLNPDVQIDADGITGLWKVVSGTQRAGMASARLRLPDGRFHPSCRQHPTMDNIAWSRGSMISRLPLGNSRSERYTVKDADDVSIVPSVAATMAMIRRDVFHKTGGFDERFFMFMEDSDLCLRLEKSGYANLFVPSAGGVHRWGRSSRQSKLSRLWRHHMSFFQYAMKHFGLARAILYVPLLFGNVILQAILPDRRPPC